MPPSTQRPRDIATTHRASRRHLLVLAGGAFLAARGAAEAQGDGVAAQAYSPDNKEREFLDLINRYRRKHGAKPLRLQDQLGEAAEHHSRDMAEKNYFKHKLSNGDSPEENIRRFGYRNYDAVGENIAAGYETAKAVMKAWKHSGGHARNMRSKVFTEIGIGRAFDKRSRYGWYWTTTFGSQ